MKPVGAARFTPKKWVMAELLEDDEDAKDFPEGFAVQLRGAAPAGVLVPFLSKKEVSPGPASIPGEAPTINS